MGIVSKQRTRTLYEDTKLSLKSKNTQLVYLDAFNNFDKFCIKKMDSTLEETVSDLKIVDIDTLYDTLQLWITYNTEGNRSWSTIKTWFSCMNNYLHYRGITLDPRDVKDNLTFPKKIEQELYGLTIQDIRKILDIARVDKKTMFLCQLSSGMRLGELLQVRKKDLTLSTKRIMIKLRPSIAKGSKARTTFFSKEAGKLLHNIIRNMEDEDLIFGSDNSTVNIVRNYNEQTLVSYCKKVGLGKKYEDSTRYLINSHSFRAFFITKLSRHDENFAKKLAGQQGYLLQYDRMSDEDKLELYLKYENDLIVLEDIKSELEDVRTQRDMLNAKLRRIEMTTYTKDEVNELIAKTLRRKDREFNKE